MNIIYISDLAGMGGGEVSLLYIMSQMAKTNNVYLLCRVPGTLVERSKELGIKVFCYDFKKNLIKSYNKFRHIIDKYDIDIVHSNELTTAILHGIQLKMMFKRSITNVCTCHGQWYILTLLKKSLIKSNIKHIFCVSDAVRKNLYNQGILNTSISYLGVPDEKFKADIDKVNLIKKNLGILENQIVIVTIARFQKIKGQLKGVQTIEKILSKHKNIMYLLIGDNIYNNKSDDEYKNIVIQYIQNNNLSHYIKLLGERNDIPELMALCDYVMITSDNESFGMVAIEAIAANKIIVSTPCDGICEILENDNNMISKENSADGLYKILLNEIENNNINEYSHKKISSLQKKFSVDEVCRKYLDIYNTA